MNSATIRGRAKLARAGTQLLSLLTLLVAFFAVPGPARADGVATGTVQIASGEGLLVDDDTAAFLSLEGANGLNLTSASLDTFSQLFNVQVVPAGNQFLLNVTIFALGSNATLSVPPCGGASEGTFAGVEAECLQGSITFTSLLSAACLAGGIYACPQNTPLQSGPFIASGEITGWTTTCFDCPVTEIFDVRVFGQGAADISANDNIGVTAHYTFTTPEPASVLLVGSGLTAVGLIRRRKHT